VAYMQDNTEVYVGLHAAAYLQELLGNDALKEAALDFADLIEIGIEGMWDVDAESYDWAIHGSGTRQPTDWSNINDANQNIWPVAFGIVSGARAQALVEQYLTEHPDWYIAAPNYYAIPSWALQRQNNPAASDEALHGILDETYTDPDGPLSYPFDSLMAGTFILAYTGGAIRHVGPPAIIGFQGGVPGPQGPRGFPGADAPGGGGLAPKPTWGYPGLALEYNGSLYTPPGPGGFTMPMDTGYGLDGYSTDPIDDALMTWDAATGSMAVKQTGWYFMYYEIYFSNPVVGNDPDNEPTLSFTSSGGINHEHHLRGHKDLASTRMTWITAGAGIGMQLSHLLDVPDGPDSEDFIEFAFFALIPLFEVTT